ncbi:MAG: Ig-like domain-containing protein [Gammaproteobacteria bacterium]|nr:Ig-like domain-containing protein [Gammaproteobacteria bacterium]MBU1448073.1 Ig-like domain-containing protein [Gammaproteobacteria bacterium]
MRTIFLTQQRLFFAFIISTFVLSGCGGSAVSTTTTTAANASAASVQLSTSATSVTSDGSSSATITATVLSSSNAVLADQIVDFASSTGLLSSASATTDATGRATFTFSAGTSGVNRTATVTATVNGTAISASLPIQITGSTLTATTNSTAVAAGTPVTISIVAKNSGAVAVSGQTLRFSVAASSTGSGTLNTTTATTDSVGAASVILTGTAAGIVDVLVEWLDATGATVSASTTKSITINPSGGSFSVSTPASSPFAAAIGTNQTVTVNVPAAIGGVAVANIRYATTLGTWLANGLKALTVVPAGATDTQTFVPGNSAGNANVQIDALDASGNVLTSASFIFSITSPTVNASSITLQSSVSVLQPSVGANLSTAVLTALVRDAANNPVGGAPVLFELVNSSGSGESLNPVVVTTDSTSTATTQMGRAQTTFTAGTSTNQNAAIKATVVGTAITTTTPVTVGGTAGSIALGAGTKLSIVNLDTAYQLPVTVMVTDSNGNAVSGAVVSISIWPVKYYRGTRANDCIITGFGPYINEDVNENLILDPGEDIDGPGFVPDGMLWPVPSAAGSVPSTVTTGVDGTATFNWVYLKQYANWLDVRIRVTTQVQGSSSTSSLELPLVPAAIDTVAPCQLPDSPFN